MSVKFTVRRIHAPTEDELHQISIVLSESNAQDSICVDGCVNELQRYYTLCRCVVSAGAAEAHQFVAFLEGSDEVIGAVTFYEPGKEPMGDERQRAHGFNAFLEALPPKATEWWGAFLPQYSALVDAKLGPGVKDAAWTVNNFGVKEKYRRMGVGRALLEAGEDYAKASKSYVIVETERPTNVPIYEHLGYSLVSQGTIKGEGQNPDFELFILRKEFA